MVLFLLVILWVVVLFPPWWKSRNARGGGGRSVRTDSFSLSPNRPDSLQALNNVLTPGMSDTVVPFRRPGAEASAAPGMTPGMSLGPVQASGQVADEFFGSSPSGFDLGTPMSREAARRRRRNVLVGLFGVAAANLGLALAFQSVFTLMFLISLAVLLGFVMLVVNHERAGEERRNKVRPLRPPAHEVPLQSAPAYLVRESAN